jgi:hypothetical protein
VPEGSGSRPGRSPRPARGLLHHQRYRHLLRCEALRGAFPRQPLRTPVRGPVRFLTTDLLSPAPLHETFARRHAIPSAVNPHSVERADRRAGSPRHGNTVIALPGDPGAPDPALWRLSTPPASTFLFPPAYLGLRAASFPSRAWPASGRCGSCLVGVRPRWVVCVSWGSYVTRPVVPYQDQVDARGGRGLRAG